MKKIIVVTSVCVAFMAFSTGVFGDKGKGEKSGEALFKENCAVCHPDGGNIINPKETLHKKDREQHNIKTVDDIVKLMRNPGPGMTKFDAAQIPDAQAKEIAEYILKTFK